MCVIFIVDKDRPSEDMVRKAWTANPAGGGVAFRKDDYVIWEKGLMEQDEMVERCATLPLPYVAHFRIPSYGGKRDQLCHPFPIVKNVPLNLKGKTKGNVLFHNGHWGKWKDSCFEVALKSGIPIPSGKWSDTRGMAFVASIYGVGILEFIDEKSVAFGPDNIEVFGTGWSVVDNIWVSNESWKYRTSNFHDASTVYRLCRETKCTKHRVGQSPYCVEHQNLEFEETENDDSLPVINMKKVENDLETKVEEANKIGPQVQTKKADTPGGSVALLPFAEIERLYNTGVSNISKNQYKKAKRRHQKETRRLKRAQLKVALRELAEMNSHQATTH